MIKRYWHWLVLAVIVAIAAGLRFYRLTEIPYSLWVDEAWFALRAREVLTGIDLMPLRPPGFGVGDSAFHIYSTAIVQAFGGPLAFSARLASAFIGVLVVGITFPIARVLLSALLPAPFQTYAALVAIAILATLLAGVIQSRAGGQMNGSVLATLLVVVCLYQTFAQAKWPWAILTGSLMAIGLTTYEAALALPLILLVYCAIRILWPQASTRRQALFLSTIMFASAAVAFAPMLVFYYLNPGIFLAHAADEQAVAEAVILRGLMGLENVVLGISLTGDLVPGRNVIGWPLFDAFTSLWLWLGLGGLVWRQWRQPVAQLLLVWLALGSLPSALSTNSPAFTRMLLMTPAFAIVSGLGAVWGWQWMARRWPRVSKWAAFGMVVGFCLSGVFSSYGYFFTYLNQPQLFDQIFMGGRRVAGIALARAATEIVWVTPRSNPYIREPFELLFENTPIQTFDVAPECQLYPHNQSRPITFGIIQVMEPNLTASLKQVYPTGTEVENVFHPDGYVFATFFQVPAQLPAPSLAQTVQVDFVNGLQLVGYEVVGQPKAGGEITLRLAWEITQPIAEAVSGFIHVGKGDASNPFIGQKDGPICPNWPTSQWEFGYRYIETRLVSIAADAPPDDYDVRIGAYLPGGDARIVIQDADVPTENNRAVLTPFLLP